MGFFRLMLAVGVLASHSDQLMGLGMITGRLAVKCFYVISGFYIAMILNEKYEPSRHGNVIFYQNRYLRLWPGYIVACVFALICCAIIGEPWRWFSLLAHLPPWQAIASALANLVMFGQDVF